jgi:hypothetical protein
VAARPVTAMLLGLFIGSTSARATDYPQAEISSGQISAKVYLPDAQTDYYRSTRFEWSGAASFWDGGFYYS